MYGLLLVDKPAGWTSFDVVNYVRRIVANAEGKKPKNVKVGHTGTLDPFATGLLVLLIGKEYTRRSSADIVGPFVTIACYRQMTMRHRHHHLSKSFEQGKDTFAPPEIGQEKNVQAAGRRPGLGWLEAFGIHPDREMHQFVLDLIRAMQMGARCRSSADISGRRRSYW